MSAEVVIVGAVTYDEIHSPAGDVDELLGGSAVHAALGAQFAAQAAPVSVVGDDFDFELLQPLRDAGVSLDGVQQAPGETFRWACRYDPSGDQRETLYTRAGVYESHLVTIQPDLLDAPYVFLTAGNPQQNETALDQLRDPRLIAVDTIEREIVTHRAGLMRVVRRSQLVSINAHEAAMLIDWGGSEEDEALPPTAAKCLRALGPETIIIKQASQGVEIFEAARRVHVSAVPGLTVVDPTGAGDAFTGALLSALARGDELVEAARWGCAVASFSIGGFGIDGLLGASAEGARERLSSVVAEERAIS